jgi:hypothetical protein
MSTCESIIAVWPQVTIVGILPEFTPYQVCPPQLTVCGPNLRGMRVAVAVAVTVAVGPGRVGVTVGVTDDVLVAYVEGRKITRPLNVDEILRWKGAGLPDAAIKAATRP